MILVLLLAIVVFALVVYDWRSDEARKCRNCHLCGDMSECWEHYRTDRCP